MEKVNLFDTNKKQKPKQAQNKPNTPLNPSSLLSNKSSKQNQTLKASTKPISHVDLNYVKQDRLLNFYKLKGTNSKITCHGRPTPKQVRSMQQMYKVNYCLTLQKQKENPLDVFKYCQDNGIEWQLIELDGANIAYMKKKEVLTRIVDGLFVVCQKLLTENLVLFVHCAAGLHRTGTVVYSLLRVFGETPESAFTALGLIREDSQREVGSERIRISETVIYPELIKRLKSNNLDPLNFDKKVLDDNYNNKELVDKSVFRKNHENNYKTEKTELSKVSEKKKINNFSGEQFKEILSLNDNMDVNYEEKKMNEIEIKSDHDNNVNHEKNNYNQNGNIQSNEIMKKIFDDLDC